MEKYNWNKNLPDELNSRMKMKEESVNMKINQ